jgi:peptide deformylase
MKKVLQVGAEELEKKSISVENPKSPETQAIIKDLLEICKAKEKTAGGLAAPQIGENLNIFVVRRVDLEEQYKKSKNELMPEKLWEVIINPKIKKLGKRKTTFWEGCLSVENGEVFGPVTRPSFVKIEYIDRYGNTQKLTAVDFLAHEIQHEIDHLMGVNFLKYVKDPQNLWKSKDLDDFIKKHGDLPDIV